MRRIYDATLVCASADVYMSAALDARRAMIAADAMRCYAAAAMRDMARWRARPPPATCAMPCAVYNFPAYDTFVAYLRQHMPRRHAAATPAALPDCYAAMLRAARLLRMRHARA